jgi:hypothetical protein
LIDTYKDVELEPIDAGSFGRITFDGTDIFLGEVEGGLGSAGGSK